MGGLLYIHNVMGKKGSFESKAPAETDILKEGCSGPLVMISGWGNSSKVFAAVRGPPERKKYALGIWDSAKDFDNNVEPKAEIELRSVVSVVPHASNNLAMVLHYKDHMKRVVHRSFERVDRSIEIWIELLMVLVNKINDNAMEKKKLKAEKKETATLDEWEQSM